MAHVSIPPKYKKLYARTLNLHIGQYLITNRFSNLLLEHGADELWQNCLEHVMRQNTVVVMAFGWTGDHCDALGLFIAGGYPQPPFLATFVHVLTDFAAWKKENGEGMPDFGQVVAALLELGAPEEALESLTAVPLEAKQKPNSKRQQGDVMARAQARTKRNAEQLRKPRIFIGSSKESLAIAEALQANLDHDFDCTIWNQGVFGLSNATIETLEQQLAQSDFAILVVTPDDVTESRDKKAASPRDNVIFELGLFMGALGRMRTFFVRPRKAELKIPSDLLGVTPATYDETRTENLQAATGAACTAIKKAIASAGIRVAK